MLGKMLPLLSLLFGICSGIGTGMFLMPPDDFQPSGEQHGADDPHSDEEQWHDPVAGSQGNSMDPPASEFVRMSNQFVIPVVRNEKIAALVVMSLSLETRFGASEEIYAREPKLRDAFLRVLFDHANMGGFHGAFTNAETMDLLRTGLREVAQKEIGPDVLDVLIVDIIRQDT